MRPWRGPGRQGPAPGRAPGGGRPPPPCQNCDGCLHTGVCIIDDDMQAIHYKLKEADRLVLAAPVFFLGLPAQAKAMVDRCQALWMEKYILKKRNMFARDGSRRKGPWR